MGGWVLSKTNLPIVILGERWGFTIKLYNVTYEVAGETNLSAICPNTIFPTRLPT